MPMEYTSVATAGLSTELVQQAYDKLLYWALRDKPTARILCDKRPGNPAMRGSSIKLEKLNYFSEAAITAAKTPLTEEADVDSVKVPAPTSVTVTPNEYGFTVTRTKKLVHRSFADVDPAIAIAVADHMNRTIDELVQDTLVTGTNDFYGGSATSVGTVAQADELTAANVRKAVTTLRVNQAVPFFGDLYAAMVHPHVVHDLREETGSGSWRVPSEYGVNQSNIWAGEIGEFEGVRFIQNTFTRKGTDGATSETVYRSFFAGREAVVEHVLEEPHTVLGPVVDKLQRFRHVGWYGDLGWALFRNEALVTYHNASSLT